jgi:hypothetical protein
MTVSKLSSSKKSDDQEARMVVAFFSVLIALVLGFGAVQEAMQGFRGGDVRPILIGLVGTVVSVLVATAGVAIWREWTAARRLGILAGLSSIVFHVFAALPPLRNVGMVAAILGVGIGLVLLAVALSAKGTKEQIA